MVGVVQDVTDEHWLRQALAASEERHRLLAENAWDVVWTMSLEGTITYVSPAVQQVRGLTPAEAMAQTIDEVHPPDSARRVQEYFAALYEAIDRGTEPPRFRGELEYYRKDGTIMRGDLQVIPHVDGHGHVLQILGVTRDISERHEFEARLTRLAVTDSLTGVWNRRHGEELIKADVYDAGRYGTPMSLLLLDVDHFKHINDVHGHHVGDLVLIELCRRLTSNVRCSDPVIRWGGEEFVIVVRHGTVDDAMTLAEKLRARVAAEPFPVAGNVTISIGVAELQPDDHLTSWMIRADAAMYEAKASGRNAVRVRAERSALS